MSSDWKIWNKWQKGYPPSYPFLSLHKHHGQQQSQLWMSPNRFLQQPRIVSNSEKPLHVFYHHHSQIKMRVGVNYFFSHFDLIMLIPLMMWWMFVYWISTRFEERHLFWSRVGVFLKNFELNNSVFLGAGWGINEALIISILAHKNEAQPK